MPVLLLNLRRVGRGLCGVLLCVVLIGCCVSPPTASPTSRATLSRPTVSPSATPYTVYLPGIGVGKEIPTEAPSPVPPTPRPTPTPLAVPKPGYGVQVHFFAGDLGTTIKWTRELGGGWVKQQVEWHTFEHSPGEFDWGPLDHVVDSCEAMGFKLLLSVVRAPDWLRAVEVESGPPADYAEFGRFMEQLATRYRGRVAAYELWNEPNLAREWRGDVLDPARFVALVAEGSGAVRAADPGALVISGAPAVTGINDGVEAVDDRVFLRGMYEAGVARWVDGIGAHPYGFANPPDESWQDVTHVASSHNDHPSFFFRDTLEDYHAIMLEYGDTEHRIWATEFGWPSVENMGSMDTAGWEYALEVSEEQQAEYIVRAFHMGDERPWVGPMFLWNVNLATIWGTGNPVSAYGLLHPDGSPRPAYLALRWAGPLER
ncbi:MAG: cellulase family glycosylhydrolase [Anaerolineae bacterium]|nr:cellulase family glycosylhydrolase [Anaerolineae bacterium]